MAAENARGAPRRVTRDVEPAMLSELLERPRPGIVAVVAHDRVDAVPVRARYHAGTYRVGVLSEVAAPLQDREVVLVLDAGAYWFELRGISVRGVARRMERAEAGERDGLAWFAIEARRVLAWDYAAIREE